MAIKFDIGEAYIVEVFITSQRWVFFFFFVLAGLGFIIHLNAKSVKLSAMKTICIEMEKADKLMQGKGVVN